jgi:polyphosphate kinase
VLKIQNQGSGENPQQRLARLAERANELAQQQARTQEQILAATLNNNPVVTATFGG